jgi:ABC-type transport system involved in cytochrome c biogenesis permease subunit
MSALWQVLVAIFWWVIHTLLEPIWNARWVALPPLTGVMMMAMIVGAVLVAPREIVEGEVQRLMYIHVPVATISYLAFFVTAVASAIFLIGRDMRWDAIARGAATVGIMLTAFALLTGAIWGKPTWGVYWSWDARLTATLVLFLIYSGYLLARAVGGPNDEQADATPPSSASSATSTSRSSTSPSTGGARSTRSASSSPPSRRCRARCCSSSSSDSSASSSSRSG